MLAVSTFTISQLAKSELPTDLQLLIWDKATNTSDEILTVPIDPLLYTQQLHHHESSPIDRAAIEFLLSHIKQPKKRSRRRRTEE